MDIILVVEQNNFAGPRDYKKTGIDGTVTIRSKKYFGGKGWISEPIDFTELTYFLGYRFEPKNIYMFEISKGMLRGGRLEGRSKSLTVVRGLAFVVLVNTRPGAERGKVVSLYLGKGKEAWGNTLFVPEGVAVAILALADDTLIYSVTDRPFNRFDSLITLDMFDPKLGIKWPDGINPQQVMTEGRTVKLDEFLETF